MTIPLASHAILRHPASNAGGETMQKTMRALAGLVGILMVSVGLGALFDPVTTGGQLFLSPVGAGGMATLRADLFGFFSGVGLMALYGALKARGEPLLCAAVILALVVVGRIFSTVVDGIGPLTVPASAAEILIVAVLLACRKSLQGPAATDAA